MNSDLKSIIERLRDAVESSGASYAQLEKLSGVPKSSIQRYVTGNTKKIPIDNLKAIAKALNVSPAYLMGWDSQDKGIPGAIPITGLIPVIGDIAAGAPILARENIIDYMPTILPNPDEYFALRVRGDSMIGAGIPDGACAVIHKQSYADDGQIVACLLNGDEATLKRFRSQGDSVILMPENSAYSPILIGKKDFENGKAQILGILKEISIKY